MSAPWAPRGRGSESGAALGPRVVLAVERLLDADSARDDLRLLHLRELGQRVGDLAEAGVELLLLGGRALRLLGRNTGEELPREPHRRGAVVGDLDRLDLDLLGDLGLGLDAGGALVLGRAGD